MSPALLADSLPLEPSGRPQSKLLPVLIHLTILQPFETGDIPILQIGKLRQGRTGSGWKSPPWYEAEPGYKLCPRPANPLHTVGSAKRADWPACSASLSFPLVTFWLVFGRLGTGSDRWVTPAPKEDTYPRRKAVRGPCVRGERLLGRGDASVGLTAARCHLGCGMQDLLC